MTDQIERVARAICKALGCNPNGMTQHFESVDGAVVRDEVLRHWQRYIPSAKAAISTMQEIEKEDRETIAKIFEEPSSPDERCCEHASDCAVHNAPAFEPGPCDCGVVT